MDKYEFELTDEIAAKINRYTRKKLDKSRIYAFPVILCDNEIDRDGERFSTAAIEKLAELFLGKTGIFDHEAKGRNQTARIFDTFVCKDESRKTSYGEDYTCLCARAYMVRNEHNAPLIEEIDAGIKKEVSVSCAVAKKVCSVCGRDIYKDPCSHIKGKSYGGVKCFISLEEPTDAFEWSFVAVPAQVSAGVAKRFAGREENADDSISAKTLDEHALMRAALEARAENLYILSGTDEAAAKAICKSSGVSELLEAIPRLSLIIAGGGTQLERKETIKNNSFKLK